MALTRIDSYLVDLDSLGGITFDDQAGVPTLKVDATTHRVGIGTAAPLATLDVRGNINLWGEIYDSREPGYYFRPNSFWSLKGGGYITESATTNGYIQIGEKYVFGFDVTTGGKFEIKTNGSSFFNGGNIGIGTTAPSTTLHINNIAHKSLIEPDRILNWYSSTGGTELHNSAHSLVIGNNHASTSQPQHVGIHLFNSNSGDNTYSPALLFGGFSGSYMNGSAGIAAKLTINGSDNNFKKGDLVFYTQGSSRGLTEKARIVADGNVGIGTTNPTQKLHVNGSLTAENIHHCPFLMEASINSAALWADSRFTYSETETAIRVYNASGFLSKIYYFGYSIDGSVYDSWEIYAKNVLGGIFITLLYDDGTNGGAWMISGWSPTTYSRYKLNIPSNKNVIGFTFNTSSSISGYEVYIKSIKVYRSDLNRLEDIEILKPDQFLNVRGGYTGMYDNVGIGTTNPYQKLDVAGYVSINNSSRIAETNTPLFVQTQGVANVGDNAGDSSPAFLRIMDRGANNLYYHGIDIRSRRSGDVRILNHDQGSNLSDLVFALDDGTVITERFRIKGFSGNVGIGTTNPTDKLHVEGGRLKVYSPSAQSVLDVGFGGANNAYKRVEGVNFVRGTSEITHIIATNQGADANSNFAIKVELHAICAISNQSSIITFYAGAHKILPATSYTYWVNQPTANNIQNTLGAGSVAWNGANLEYTTGSGVNYVRYIATVTIWAHDRMNVTVNG